MLYRWSQGLCVVAFGMCAVAVQADDSDFDLVEDELLVPIEWQGDNQVERAHDFDDFAVVEDKLPEPWETIVASARPVRSSRTAAAKRASRRAGDEDFAIIEHDLLDPWEAPVATATPARGTWFDPPANQCNCRCSEVLTPAGW